MLAKLKAELQYYDYLESPDFSAQEISQNELAEAFALLLALKKRVELIARNLSRDCHIPAEQATAFENATKLLVEATIRDRARRRKFLPDCEFADPAWDVLLELYRAELEQHRVSVSALCAASNVPTTTALRWISTLEAQGLVARNPDPFDRRRFYVRLTVTGSTAMTLYFSTADTMRGEQPCAS